jgi:putative membrane protein insertion efficiency factor
MSAVAPQLPAPAPARWMRGALIAAIRIYQIVFAPLLAPACRFEPSCSTFAVEAIARRGVVRGSWLALRRIARCHPWGGFGYDPVP